MMALRSAAPTAVGLATFLFLVAGTAAAEDVCRRTPAWGQVPEFWDPDPSSPSGAPRKQMQARYDGRWAGASHVPLDNGSSGARARFVEGGDGALYVALEIDATGTDRDVFWIGLANAAATDSAGAMLIEISVLPNPDPAAGPGQTQLIEQKPLSCGAVTCPGTAPCNATPCVLPVPAYPRASYRILRGVAPTAGFASKFVWDAPAFDATVAAQAALNPATGGSRAWHGPLYAGTAGQPTGATVMLRLPDSFLSPASVIDHKVWVAAASCDFLGTGPVNCNSQGNWPSAGLVTEVAPDTYSAPAVSDWALLHRTTATPCPEQSTLVAAGVQNGVTYNPAAAFTWPQRIHLDNNGNPADDPANWFGARVAMTLTSVANRYRARFFVADWGSQIGNLDVSQWTEIGHTDNPGVAGGTPAAPVTEHLSMRWPPASMTAADQKVLACKYSKCDSSVAGCPYPSNASPDQCVGVAGARTHHPHQCTQVRLEALPGAASYQFAQDSMIFNTDFVGASVFWRVATISTLGIKTVTPAPKPAPPEGRDIYIHVRALNMPAKSDEVPAESTVARLEQLGVAAGKAPPGKRPPPEAQFARNLREHLGGNNDRPDPRRQAKVIEELRKLPIETVRMVAPTLEFHVYYDGGSVMDTHPGKPSHWLTPMTSFRYVVEHVGPIQGWEWAIDGAKSLGNNWFHLRLADGGEHKIRTRLQAVEDKRMPAGNPVWPPGKAWINEGGGKPASAKVKVTKQSGCSVGHDAGGAGVLLLAAAAWIAGRRRRAS